MENERQDFIAAAVAGLGDDLELKLAARQALESFVPDAAEGRAQAISGWRAADGKPRRPFTIAAIFLLLLLVSAPILFFPIRDLSWQQGLFRGRLDPLREARAWYEARGVSHDDALILFGDDSQADTALRLKGLVDRFPENPAYYLAYVGAYWRDRRKVPPDFDEVISRIDPDNAFPVFLSASSLGNGAVRRDTLTWKERKEGKPASWTILDQTKLDAAVSRAAEAVGKPVFDFRQRELALARYRLLMDDGSLRSRSYSNVILHSHFNIAWASGSLREVFPAKAMQLAERGDREGFLKLLATMEACAEGGVAGSTSVFDWLVATGIIKAAYPAFERAAGMLGLEEERGRLAAVIKWAKERSMGGGKEAGDLLRLHGDSSVAGMDAIHGLAPEAGAVTPERLHPGSRHDHALASRMLAACVWIVFAVIAGLLACRRYLSPRLVRALAGRTEQLLRAPDYLWIAGLGGLLPCVGVMGISLLTPLGGREFSLWGGARWFLPAGHFIALAILVPMAMRLAAAWRLGKRAGALGMGRTWKWPYAMMICLASASVPLLGVMVVTQSFGLPFQFAAGFLLAVPLIGLITVLSPFAIGPLKRKVESVAIAGILLPGYAAAMVLVIALIPLFRWQEVHWFRKYDFARVTEASAPVMEYEKAVTDALRDELLGVLRR